MAARNGTRARGKRRGDSPAELRQTLLELMKLPENSVCADCPCKQPRWASSSLGVFVCIQCSGIHRNLGTHISFVRSVNLDDWKPDQVARMELWGNGNAKAYFEANVPRDYPVPRDGASVQHVTRWIKDKYEYCKFTPRDNGAGDPRKGAKPNKLQVEPAPAPPPAAFAPAPRRAAPAAAKAAPKPAPPAPAPPPKQPEVDLLNFSEEAVSPPPPPPPPPQAPQAPQPAEPAAMNFANFAAAAPAAFEASFAAPGPPAPAPSKADSIMSMFNSQPANMYAQQPMPGMRSGLDQSFTPQISHHQPQQHIYAQPRAAPMMTHNNNNSNNNAPMMMPQGMMMMPQQPQSQQQQQQQQQQPNMMRQQPNMMMGQQQPNMMMGQQQLNMMMGQQQPNMMMGQQQPNMMMGQQQQPKMGQPNMMMMMQPQQVMGMMQQSAMMMPQQQQQQQQRPPQQGGFPQQQGFGAAPFR